jgi:hypothetical protein
MKSIETRYHGPTNTRGARISATDCGDHVIYVSADMSEKSGEDLHREAAVELCIKLGWVDYDKLVGGATKAGYVFVFPPKATA